VASFDLLSTYMLIMELRFDAMLYSNLGNENSDAVCIKCLRGHLACGPQVSQPWLSLCWYLPNHASEML